MTSLGAESASGLRQPPTVGDVIAVMERLYPTGWAADWDVVGLAVGSRSMAVRKILFAVEVTFPVVAEAAQVGANLIIAHHPLLLHGVTSVTDDHPKGRVIMELLRHDVCVYVAHTNADVAAHGVVAALAETIGMVDTRPMVCHPVVLDKIITFAPLAHTESIIDALSNAGAGAVGSYHRAAFHSDGTGTFRPMPGSSPYLGVEGEIETVAERRIEMVLPRHARPAVVQALLAAHPYETPAYDVIELADSPSDEVGEGRIGALPEPLTLNRLADRLAEVLPATAAGLRVGGDPERVIQTLAVQAGAGGDLLDRARTLRVDAYITSDLRHHPASDALAWPEGPALIDIPHWAAEWTWLPIAERLVRLELHRLGFGVDTEVSQLRTDPWIDRR